MDLRRLEYFLALARLQHFGRAAESLHVSQPGLSQQIRVLESELGVQLIDRSTKPVSLTTAGEVLREKGAPLLVQANACVQQVQSVGMQPSGELRVAYTRSGRELNMHSLVEEYRRVYPDVSLLLSSDWTSRNMQALVSGEIDIAFGRSLAPTLDVESMVIAREELVVALPRTHPLAQAKRLSPGEIIDLPLVHWSRALGADYVDDIKSQIWGDHSQKIYMEQPDTENILSEVARGIGIAIVDQREAARVAPEAVCLLRFRDPVPFTSLSVAWISRGRAKPALNAFIAMCETHEFLSSVAPESTT